MTKTYQDNLKVPLHFVQFAHMEGKMYRHYRNESTFVTGLTNKGARNWGNNVVYGGLFHLDDFSFHIRKLDAYHSCSKSALRENHLFDLHHRNVVGCTPIYFDTLDELSRLKYREGEPIEAHAYFGNEEHRRIMTRFNVNNRHHRVISGVQKDAFRELYEEVRE